MLSKLIPYAEEISGDHQCGFPLNRSKIDPILCIRQIPQKNENTTKQYIRCLLTSGEIMIHLGGRSCIIFLLNLVSP